MRWAMRVHARYLFLSSCLWCLSGFAAEGKLEFSEEELVSMSLDFQVLSRADSLPVENFDEVSDTYLEAYIQALIDVHYYEQQVIVTVKDHHVYLSNLPRNDLLRNSILSFVSEVPGVKSVQITEAPTKEERAAKGKYFEKPAVPGIWFPQATVLFQPFVADPRWPTYWLAYRGGDHVVGRNAVSVSLGDQFPIFRWRDILPWHGDMQIGIEADLWAVFNFSDLPKSDNGDFSELFNADYYLGIPVEYAVDRWSFRTRIYHISSHLGDEFMCRKREMCDKRKNPSFEAIDFFASYQVDQNFRVYAGPGVIIHSDDTFPMKYFYLEYGMELRWWGRKSLYHKIYGTPFLAIHVENWQVRHWNSDETYMIGYEWSKMQGIGRKFRVYADYHRGFSYEGQFFKKPTQYGEVGFKWGF
jgi:hypothetical protein